MNTIRKPLVEKRSACAAYQDAAFVNLRCKRIHVDEIWSFVWATAKNVPEDNRGEFGMGDAWTWTAICSAMTLVPSGLVGGATLNT